MNSKKTVLNRIVMRKLCMNLKNSFTTSFGTLKEKEFLLVEAIDEDGNSGWGESVAIFSPWYNEETVKTNESVMEDFLIPFLFKDPIVSPEEIRKRFMHIRRNNMAKSALETAVWDLFAKKNNIALTKALGGKKDEIEVGISIGIQNSIEHLLSLIDRYVDEGYKRIKIKIMPGWDIDVLEKVRDRFPDIPLMVDANSAYTLKDLEILRRLDEFNLMMIEQPLGYDDIIDHAELQSQINTPICLDESIHSLGDARKAIKLGSCKIINIKIGRVGGLTEAKEIHDYCAEKKIPVWCGGMLESGIGRAHNIALTTLSNFILPGDTAPSSHYWNEDIIEPEVTADNGTIKVPSEPGIGYSINRIKIDKFTVCSKTYMNK
ncbi:MAG: o-succinylbenzoate synthase [bacterium]|nr:MAG: o-succinylbenzoate synthase [bacterium]